MARRLGGRTPKEELEKYSERWGINPPPRSKILSFYKKGMTVPQIADELGTSSTFVEGVLRTANPRVVIARPSFKYAHEEVADWDKLKRAHPEATIRTVSMDSHRLRVAYWGKVAGYRTYRGKKTPIHAESQLVSILHPAGEDKACAFVAQLRKSGKLRELLEKGRLPIKAVANVQYLPCPHCREMNPVRQAGLRLKCYACGTQLLAVRVKRNNSRR